MSTASWEGILDKGEKIIWQGRPDGKIVWRVSNIMTLIFGLFFAGFALFWMLMAASAGGFFWMFGLIHFFVGIGIAFGAVFWSAYMRRRSWYTLTDRRAFIARDLPVKGRVLKSYPITGNSTLEMIGSDPVTLYFASETKRGKNRTYQVKVGFERISDGREVYSKIRTIQKGAG